MEEAYSKKYPLQELENLYLFKELIQLVSHSTGLSLAVGYLILLLSSMSYLHILYNALDFNVLQFLTFEDILATPVKNPIMVYIFLLITLIFFVTDAGIRYRVSMHRKYAGEKFPLGVRIVLGILWGPKRRKAYIRQLVFIIIFSLITYIVAFSLGEASDVKKGKGERVEITLSDDSTLQTTLLSTTSNFVLTFDHTSGEPTAYYVETIKLIQNIPQE